MLVWRAVTVADPATVGSNPTLAASPSASPPSPLPGVILSGATKERSRRTPWKLPATCAPHHVRAAARSSAADIQGRPRNYRVERRRFEHAQMHGYHSAQHDRGFHH